MSDYISNQILTCSLNVEARYIKGDVNKLLYNLLKKKYEGVCNKDGYIQNDSLEMINRSVGEVKTIDNTSYVVYNITYKANIYSPVKGIELPIYINSITKMGIIGYIKEKDEDTIEKSPFIVIVPKEYFTEDVYDNYTVNDKLTIKIMDARIKYMSKNIQIVGHPV